MNGSSVVIPGMLAGSLLGVSLGRGKSGLSRGGVVDVVVEEKEGGWIGKSGGGMDGLLSLGACCGTRRK